MSRRATSRLAVAVLLGGPIVFAGGCVHPLGPGYEFADRQAEIRVSGDQPGRIRVRVDDRLENAGNGPLHSLEVRLPEGAEFRPQNLRVLIDGTEVATERSSSTDVRMMRAPFDPVWQQDQTRHVVTEWDLAPDFSPRGTVVASPDGFFIADETAFPLWQTPKGIFARGGTKPDKEVLTVITPPDFRVVASGKALKRTGSGSQVAQRFLIQPVSEFFPYVVAGRYRQRLIRTPQGEVQFWTFRDADPSVLQAAAPRLAASMKSLTDFFGPPSGPKVPVRIAESPVELPPEFGESANHGAASFPEGALLDPHAFQALNNDTVLELAEYELARTWFGWEVRPRADAQILMGRGIGLFGLVIAAEGRGRDERERMIASLIDRYDASRAAAPDKRLMGPIETYSRAERISTGYRAALFFVALEDVCGRDSLKTVFRQIIYSRASSDTGDAELRAALEEESKKDLADMFREWLIQPGIPDDFRGRYKRKSTTAANLKFEISTRRAQGL